MFEEESNFETKMRGIYMRLTDTESFLLYYTYSERRDSSFAKLKKKKEERLPISHFKNPAKSAPVTFLNYL